MVFTESEVHHGSSGNVIVLKHQTAINPVRNILSSAEYNFAEAGLKLPNMIELNTKHQLAINPSEINSLQQNCTAPSTI